MYKSSDVSEYQKSFYALVVSINEQYKIDQEIENTVAYHLLIKGLRYGIEGVKAVWQETKNTALDYHNKIDFVRSDLDWEHNDYVTVQHREFSGDWLRFKVSEVEHILTADSTGEAFPHLITLAQMSRGRKRGGVVIDYRLLAKIFLTEVLRAAQGDYSAEEYLATSMLVPKQWRKIIQQNGDHMIVVKAAALEHIFPRGVEYFCYPKTLKTFDRGRQQRLAL